MLKIVSENFIHALLLFLGLFLKISRWVPLNAHYAYRNLEYFIEDIKMRRSQIQSSMSDEETEKLYPVENR